MRHPRIRVTGLGIVSSLGLGVHAVKQAVLSGTTGLTVVGHPDLPERHAPLPHLDLAALLPRYLPLDNAERVNKTIRRSSTLARAGVLAAAQAWTDSGAERRIDPARVGVVGAGNNLTSAAAQDAFHRYDGRLSFASPRAAVDLLDTSLVSHIAAALNLQGHGVQVGAASASGNAALIHGCRLITSGETDACLVVGSVSLPSTLELRAMANTGALSWSGTSVPFSMDRKGFIPGEAAVAVMLEPGSTADSVRVHGWIRGWAERLHPTAGPEPDAATEAEVMGAALDAAGIDADGITYVNAHATGSNDGDAAELAAAEEVFRRSPTKPWINSTKSVTGHCLSAAGLVELLVTLVQLNCGALHPTVGLRNPAPTPLRHPQAGTRIAGGAVAISNSYGFGGFNTTLVLSGAHQ